MEGAEAKSGLELVACPSCGGAGGGPFGPAGSAWDDEEYECTRCKGVGAIALDDVMTPSVRPGIVKAVPGQVAPAAADHPTQKKRKASA